MPTFCEKLLSKKKPWTPTLGSVSSVAPGSEDCIGRALALRTLEIPVGEWITEGCKRELSRLSPDMIQLLESNIVDEHKHDVTLNLAHNAYKLTSSSMQSEAETITQEWVNHPDHPIVKAWVIENAVFFVILPIFRLLGGTGLRLVSTDISNDETIHVAANRHISSELGFSYSPSLDHLRKRTVAWIVENLDCEGKYGYPDFWLNSSDDLLVKGVAPQLKDTSAYVMPAFFEHENSNLPMYN